MAKNISEKSLGAMIDEALVDNFTAQVEQRGSKIKRALAAAVKLWISLPEEIQARLLNQNMEANGLVEFIEEIIDERIQADRKVARKSLRHSRKKRGQKG